MTRSKPVANNQGTAKPSTRTGRGSSPRPAASKPPAPGAPAPVVPTAPVELPPLGIAVASNWGWRIMATFTLVASGLCLTFFLDGKPVYGALWVIVTVAWGYFTNLLRLRHMEWDRS